MSIKILVVDDEYGIREMLKNYLELEDYEVVTAEDGINALEILEKEYFNLILSDINMPRMQGFELLQKVKEKYPHIKRILITAYDIQDYMKMIMDYDVGNVLTKTVPFNYNELKTVVENLVTGNIFGIEKYLSDKCEINSQNVYSADDVYQLLSNIEQYLHEDCKNINKMKIVVMELLTNAVFYGARNEDGDDKEKWKKNFRLKEEEKVIFNYGQDEEKYGFSIVDNGGKLSKHTVLYWLNRQISKDETGLPVGLMDTHGRGIFISREYVDRFIVNIKKGVKTEVIALNYIDKYYHGYKSLYINEI